MKNGLTRQPGQLVVYKAEYFKIFNLDEGTDRKRSAPVMCAVLS